MIAKTIETLRSSAYAVGPSFGFASSADLAENFLERTESSSKRWAANQKIAVW